MKKQKLSSMFWHGTNPQESNSHLVLLYYFFSLRLQVSLQLQNTTLNSSVWGDHCNHCNHFDTDICNLIPVNQWVCFALLCHRLVRYWTWKRILFLCGKTTVCRLLGQGEVVFVRGKNWHNWWISESALIPNFTGYTQYWLPVTTQKYYFQANSKLGFFFAILISIAIWHHHTFFWP